MTWAQDLLQQVPSDGRTASRDAHCRCPRTEIRYKRQYLVKSVGFYLESNQSFFFYSNEDSPEGPGNLFALNLFAHALSANCSSRPLLAWSLLREQYYFSRL